MIWVLFVSQDTVGRMTEVLNGRVMLDVYPNRIRNCIYSLQPTIAFLLSMPLIFVLSQLLPIVRFPFVFAIAAIVTFAGAMLVRKGFKYPIPKDESIEEVLGEDKEEIPEVPQAGIPELPIPAEIPAQTHEELPKSTVFVDISQLTEEQSE
jgi:hypothetical protein